MKYERGDIKIPDLRAMLTKDKLKINGYFIIKNLQVNEKNKFDFIDLEILITLSCAMNCPAGSSK